jgi:N,N'-diacetyllegionaminate synthase
MAALVIAEAGVNHNGDMGLAMQLIEVAADAGADVVKFQTFKADQLATTKAAKASYQKQTTDKTENQQVMLKRLELTSDQHKQLISHCHNCGIEFLSTAFDDPSIDLLNKLFLKRFKIPSGEITNLPYLRRIGGLGKPLILSTGMANLGEIEAALAVLETAGTNRDQITVLHCTTEYPAPMAEVNLRAMQTIGQSFGVAVGYSDHTAGIEVPIAAVALGATVIEKHFTLDQNLPGPDHKASLEPKEFAAMVNAIRNIELALGDGIKRATASEAANLPIVRKSLVASRAISIGELFSATNITAKRPGSGISPMRWDELIGHTSARAFEPDELIEL